MILGSKASTYAILAVIEIARHNAENKGNGAVRACEIAEQFGLPAAYAAKVMTQLARADILHSGRGPRGGYRLTRPPHKIAILDVVEAVDGQIEFDPGMLGTSATSTALRGVNQVLGSAVGEVRHRLAGHHISEFIGAAAPAREPELPRLRH